MAKVGKRRVGGNKYGTLKYRPNVCLLIFNKEKKILIGKRANSNIWQLPQGGVESNTLIEAGLREAFEELGIAPSELIPVEVLDHVNTYTFKTPKDYGDDVYQGQSQRFVVFKFMGHKIDLTKATSKELEDIKWIELPQIAKECDPLRQRAYRKVIDEIQRKGILSRI